MAIRGNAASIAEKWARRTGASIQDYSAGIDRVTESPGEKAAQAQDAYVAGIQEAVSSGRWAAGLRKTSLADWKNAAKNKGAARLAQGVQAAQPKMQQKFQSLITAIEAAQSSISNIPRTTFQGRLQRMTAFATAMHDRKGQI